jgi:hypothetical protein
MSIGVGVQESLVRFLQQTTLKPEIDEVQQPPHCLAPSASSRCVRASVNKVRTLLRGFGTTRSQVQILSPRPSFRNGT